MNLRSERIDASMFLRMMVRAAVLRRGRVASALGAVVVAATVATAMLNLYVDVQAKLRREFRNYGANLIVIGKQGASLPADSLARVDQVLGDRGVAAPMAMIVARTHDHQPVVVAGTDFNRARQLDKYWSVSSWPQGPQQALVGVKALATVAPNRQPFDLTFQRKVLNVIPAGTVETGAAEDSRIYLWLRDFTGWTGVMPSLIEVAVSGTPEQITAVMNQMGQAIPGAEVRPVRQIMEGEARVLGKTRSTLLAGEILIILTAGLCVLATLMGWVFDRRRDFAIMKSLGASGPLLSGFFAAEAAALGAIGAVIGFLGGIGIAAWIGRVNFHAAVVPRFSVLPIILAGSIAVTLVSAILPISLLRRVQPAVILRGE
jgi:putative ABC transport system permease protein